MCSKEGAAMASIVVRKLSDATKERLRQRAARHRRSLQAEVGRFSSARRHERLRDQPVSAGAAEIVEKVGASSRLTHRSGPLKGATTPCPIKERFPPQATGKRCRMLSEAMLRHCQGMP
jgi:plasmid stability protein